MRASPRIYLFFPAIVLKLVASAVSAAGFVEHSGPLYLAGMILWMLWFGLLLLIAWPRTDELLLRFHKKLLLTARLLVVVVVLFGAFELSGTSTIGLANIGIDVFGPNSKELLSALNHSFAYNDATALCHQAANNVRLGLNPYAEANIVKANLLFGNPFDKTTPRRVGRFVNDFPYPTVAELQSVWEQAVKDPGHIPPEIESRLAYPAGCFLLPLPLLVLGINDLRWAYLIILLPALAFALVRAQGNLRWWLLAGMLASLEIWNSIASGETGILFFAFLLMAWILVRRKLWLAALCLGFAIAAKQLAWFFAPYFLILVLRTEGFKKAALAGSIAIAVFAAFNLPFIFQDAQLWLSSITAPMNNLLFPIGVGLVSLVTGGYWHLETQLVFGILEVLTGIASVVWYYFNYSRAPHIGLVLAVVPLFFAWRSMWSYFYFFDLILFAVIVLYEYKQDNGKTVLIRNRLTAGD